MPSHFRSCYLRYFRGGKNLKTIQNNKDMDNFKLIVVLASILLPIVVTFGWRCIKKMRKINSSHRFLSFDEDPYLVTCPGQKQNNEDEEEIELEEQYKQRKPDEFYC